LQTAFDRFSNRSRTNTQINVGNTSDSILTGNTGLEIVQRGYGEIGSEAVKASEEIRKLTDVLERLNLDSYQRETEELQQKIDSLVTEMSTNVDGQKFGSVYQQLDQSATQAVLMHEKLKHIQDTFRNGLGSGVEESVQKAEDYIKSIINALQQIAPLTESTKQKLLDYAGTNEQLVTESLNRMNQTMQDALNSEIDYVDERTRRTEEVEKFNDRLNDIRTSIDDTIDQMLADISKRASSVNNVNETIQTLTDMMSKYASASLFSEINSLTDEIREAIDVNSQENANTFANRYQDTLLKIVTAQRTTQEGNVEFYKNTTNMVHNLQSSLTDIVERQLKAIDAELQRGATDNGELEQKKQELMSLSESIKTNSEAKLDELLSLQKEKIQQAININAQRQSQAVVFGSDENTAIRHQIASQNLSGINYSGLAGAGDIDNALAQLEYSSGMNNPWYQYVKTGNLLGDKTTLAANMRTTQMYGYTANSIVPNAIQALQNQSLNATDRATMIGKLAGANSDLTQSILATGKDMHLHAGGAKNLNNADKQVFAAFQSQINIALQNLTRSIRAIEELDPNNATLSQLKKEQAELIKLKQTADKAKESSSAIADIFGTITNGVNKLKNILAGG